MLAASIIDDTPRVCKLLNDSHNELPVSPMSAYKIYKNRYYYHTKIHSYDNKNHLFQIAYSFLSAMICHSPHKPLNDPHNELSASPISAFDTIYKKQISLS